MVRRTDVPSPEESKATSSTSVRMRGMPSPRSKFKRSGSVTGGCSGSVCGSNPLPRPPQGEVAVVTAEPLQAANQHAETGRVEEVDALEVHDDLVLPLADQLDQLLPQAGCGVDVDLPPHRQNGVRRVAVVDVETELHAASSL